MWPGFLGLDDVVESDAGDTPALYRRDLLLPQRRVRDEAVVDLVAARLLVIGDQRAEGDVLLRQIAWFHYVTVVVAAALATRGRASPPAAANPTEPRSTERRVRVTTFISSPQACSIGYFAKISSIRLNALSAAASGVIPFWMMSIQPWLQTCSVWTCA
jgi:hypothetical protein